MNLLRFIVFISLFACLGNIMYFKHIALGGDDASKITNVIVIKEGCNLRVGPGMNFRVLRKMKADENGQTGAWYVTDTHGNWSHAHEGTDNFWVHKVCITHETK